MKIRLQDCISPENMLALGLYHLAHRNFYKCIWPNFIIGRSTVMEAVQDNVEALWNEYIKFPITEVEMQVYIHTFQDVADLLHIVG